MKNRMKRFMTLLLAMSLVAGSLSACGQKENSETSAESAETVQVQETSAEETTDTYIPIAAHRDQIQGTKDWMFTQRTVGVWEALLTIDEEGRPIPQLAEAYEKNEDATEWTFHLRQDVTFHEGQAFNADIVLANFDRWKTYSPLTSTFTGMNINTTYPGLQDVIKVDDYTVKLTFENPVPMLDWDMVDYGSAIIHPDCLGDDGYVADLPNCTGPYKVLEYKEGEYGIVVPNENYWGEKAKNAGIKYLTIPELETRYSAMLSEEVMGLVDLGAITPLLAEELLADPEGRFEVTATTNNYSHGLYFNGNMEEFQDVRLRQAVSLAMERQVIVDEFYNGYGIVNQNFIHSKSKYYVPVEVNENLEEAQALAKEVLGDERMHVVFLLRSRDLERYPFKEEAEYIQSRLSLIGIDTEIQILETSAYDEARKAGEFGITLRMVGYPGNKYSSFQSYLATDGSNNQKLCVNYSNPEMDQLLADLKSETDETKRQELMTAIQELFQEDMPFVPLNDENVLVATNKRITGLEANRAGTFLTNAEWVH